MQPITVTATLADYMAARGLEHPRIGMAWIIDRWTSLATATGALPTFDRIIGLAQQGVRRLELTFDDGTRADFAIGELIPRTGIAAHGEIREILA